MTLPISAHPVEQRIVVMRGQRVMIDADLAELYGVTTKRLNEQIKRNQQRFRADFMFQLTADEKAEVVANCDHLARLKFSRTLPYAFTEHGAIQASNVLASAQAVEMGVYVVRAFVRLREVVRHTATGAARAHEPARRARRRANRCRRKDRRSIFASRRWRHGDLVAVELRK